MASKNQLLGAGIKEEEEVVTQQKQLVSPKWMYSIDCPTGRLVKTQKELDELLSLNWKDHPGKVQKLPGHEHLFEEEFDLSVFSKDSAKESKIDFSVKTKVNKKG